MYPARVITREFADAFAAEWIAAWNARDLDRILSHYAPDFSFSSPFIAERFGEPGGILRGHDAMRAYWGAALSRQPGLRFALRTVLAGVASVVIVYDRHDGRVGAEHFEFGADGKVLRSSAHYAPAAEAR